MCPTRDAGIVQRWLSPWAGCFWAATSSFLAYILIQVCSLLSPRFAPKSPCQSIKSLLLLVINPMREYILITVLTALTLTFGFYATDQYMALQLSKGIHFWKPSLPWDTLIPLRSGWIWIYLSYFPICFFPVIFTEIWKDIRLFRRTALGFILQFAVALAFFWIVPSQMERLIFHPNSLSEEALAWFYKIDAGFNVFPSLHIANITYTACLAWRFRKKALSIGVWVLCALIALSTLFVKQHYFLDLPAGCLLGLLGYKACFPKALQTLTG